MTAMDGCRLLYWNLLISCFSLAFSKHCGYPGWPSNGTVNVTDKQVHHPGATVEYTCPSKDQKLVHGDKTRTCQHDGTWSGLLPVCVYIIHPSIKLDVNKNSTRHIQRRLKSLTDGDMDTCVLLASDDENLLTLTSQHTRIDSALLQFKDPLPNLENGRWLSCSTAEVKPADGQSISLEVRRGLEEKTLTFSINHSNLELCEITTFGRPLRGGCGVPEIPVNGHVTTENLPGMATYSCSPGYHLIGQQIRRCTDGQWTGPQPVCVLNKLQSTRQMESVSTEEATTAATAVTSVAPTTSIVGLSIGVFCAGALSAILVVAVYAQFRKWRSKREQRLNVEAGLDNPHESQILTS